MGNQNQKLKKKSKRPQQLTEDQHVELDEEEEETFTCEICIEPVPNNSKFRNSNRCVHPFCTDCIIKYIQANLEDNVSDIKCPAINCKHSFEPLLCRPKIPHALFDKWCDILCVSTLLRVDKVYCPNIECLGLILNECGNKDKLKRCVCHYCQKPYCYTCKVPWHDGYSCKESWKMHNNENDDAFQELYERNKWQRCPKCRHGVERVAGCNTVKCRCGIVFCYVTGTEEEEENVYSYDLLAAIVCALLLSFCFLYYNIY